ncbi:MAG: CrcB family protein [Alcaligenaceae bacterium]|nr:CrcB family protein [Alcaligenaceae bacterium]
MTTFSTFSLESIELIVAGRWGFAVIYVLMTMSLTLLACFVSYQAAVRIL